MINVFKAGDKVRYQTGKASGWEGCEGTVFESDQFGTRLKLTKVGKHEGVLGYQYHLTTSRLELVPAFKVGDVVTFIMKDFAPWQGGRGVIIKHEVEDGKDNFYVKVTEVPPANGSIRAGHTAWLWPEWLKLVEEVKDAHPSNGKADADMVNGPSHYGGADNPYEAIKVAEAWGFEKNAYLFNALKYLARAERKGRKVEDLKKLQFYVNREIALEEAK